MSYTMMTLEEAIQHTEGAMLCGRAYYVTEQEHHSSEQEVIIFQDLEGYVIMIVPAQAGDSIMAIPFAGHLIIPESVYDEYLADRGLEVKSNFPLPNNIKAAIILSLKAELGE